MENNELKRLNWNSWMFILSYIFMGILSGVAFDVLVTFLQEASPSTATSFSTWMGVSTFLGAGILFIVPKLGYKKVIMVGPIVCIASLLAIAYVKSDMIFLVATIGILTGMTLFDVVLPPMLNAYTTPENRQKIFSRALYTNVAGMVLATYFGGTLIVWRFSAIIGKTYSAAKALTADVEALKAGSGALYAAYVNAHKEVLLIFAVVCLTALIPLLFLKERKLDYKEEENKPKEEKQKFNWSLFSNKYILAFLAYYALVRFGASLICPYFSVYMTKFIGLDRATASNLVSYQYFAMVIFMMASPWVVKKFGQVVALGGLSLLSIPFMLFIANGRAFGGSAALVVGISLFLRSGLMNAANPVMNSLPMEFVSKELRPGLNSVIFISGGVTSILAGMFTTNFLFKNPAGYGTAYYITACVYTVSSAVLLAVCTKKYNRSHETESKDAEKIA